MHPVVLIDKNWNGDTRFSLIADREAKQVDIVKDLGDEPIRKFVEDYRRGKYLRGPGDATASAEPSGSGDEPAVSAGENGDAA